MPRQASLGWRLTSSLPATRLSPKSRILAQMSLFWCVYIRFRLGYVKFLQNSQTRITPTSQQRSLIDILCVVANSIENLASSEVYIYKS